MKLLAELSEALEAGQTTSLSLVEACLERADDPAGEGARTFIMLDPDRARRAAARADERRRAGPRPSPLAGIPISIKAVFDLEGKVTTAASRLLEDRPPAAASAHAVARLEAAGMVVMGHTNMTEFAASGLGINPHFGTPRNPFDRAAGRIPGGSSSGAAISVSDEMAAVALGTDTGGSCRIPAALCGLVGFKPTARRMPRQGMFPLSPSFDTVGVLARSVACCARVDAVLAGDAYRPAAVEELSGRRFGVLENYVMEAVTPDVAIAYNRALATLEQAGAQLLPLTLPDLERLPSINAHGGIVAAESYAIHKGWLATHSHCYDPRVLNRLIRGKTQPPGDLDIVRAARQAMIDRFATAMLGLDAVLMPTTPLQAPLIDDLDTDASYDRANLLMLRNPSLANFLDGCAISLPIPSDNGLPVGLTLMGSAMTDHGLLAVAGAVEQHMSHRL